MQYFAAVMTMFFLTTKLFAAELPTIVRSPDASGDDRVGYFNVGGRLEEWEIVKGDWIQNGTYLNFSGFPWGEVEYLGAPTVVCGVSVDGTRFVGVAGSADRLKLALQVVIADQLGAQAANNSNIKCENVSTVFQRDSKFEDLQKFADSL